MNVMVKKEWIEKGCVDEPVDETSHLKAEIRKLCKAKDAIILAHYYTAGEIPDIADFVGDSLDLARKAAETDENPITKTNHINNSDQRAEYPDGFLLFFIFHKSVDKCTENSNNNFLISL